VSSAGEQRGAEGRARTGKGEVERARLSAGAEDDQAHLPSGCAPASF